MNLNPSANSVRSPDKGAAMGGRIAALGYALLSLLGDRSGFFEMLPAFALIPGGIGFAVPAMTAAILSSVDRSRSGTASAILNAARQVGGAIGVAMFGALVSGVSADQIISGLKSGALTAAGLMVGAAIVALHLKETDNSANRGGR